MLDGDRRLHDGDRMKIVLTAWERLLKMVKQTIGMQYYDYKRLSDPASVMYSRRLGVQDLDRMGYAF